MFTALAVILAVFSFGQTAAEANPDLERARRFLGELFVEKAAEAFEDALKRGDSDPATTAQIYLGLGEVAATMGDDKKAEEQFKRALAIDTLLDLPAGASPKVQAPLSKARSAFRKVNPLAALVNIDTAEGVRASVSIVSDPFDMVAGASVVYETDDGENSKSFESDEESVRIPLPSDAIAITVSLIDEHGNRLVTNDRVELPDGERVGDSGDGDSGNGDSGDGDSGDGDSGNGDSGNGGGGKRGSSGDSFITNWMVWGGAAVVFGATGTGFGLWSRSAVNEIEELKKMSGSVEFKTVLDLEDKAKQRALIANISFGVAGACAVAAAVFYFTQDDDDESKKQAAFLPSVGPNHVGVSAILSF